MKGVLGNPKPEKLNNTACDDAMRMPTANTTRIGERVMSGQPGGTQCGLSCYPSEFKFRQPFESDLRCVGRCED
jgi:hypothetical protein